MALQAPARQNNSGRYDEVLDGAEEECPNVVVYCHELGRLNRKRIGIRYWSFLFCELAAKLCVPLFLIRAILRRLLCMYHSSLRCIGQAPVLTKLGISYESRWYRSP